MPRSIKPFKTRKKAFHGVRLQEHKAEEVMLTSSKQMETPPSASSFKIRYGGTAYDFVDVMELNKSVSPTVVCSSCGGKVSFSVISRNGLASTIQTVCEGCPNQTAVRNSKKEVYNIEGMQKHLETINLQFLYAMRSISKGYASAKLFCGIMNLPPPSTKHFLHQKATSAAVEKVCLDSMKKQLRKPARQMMAAEILLSHLMVPGRKGATPL